MIPEIKKRNPKNWKLEQAKNSNQYQKWVYQRPRFYQNLNFGATTHNLKIFIWF
jgi:hypothetical protein